MNFPHSNKPTFIIKTLGCKVNQYESELMRQDLEKNDFFGSKSETADFYIINSCTVTHKADRDARRLIRHYHQINPNGQIIVCGCYAELKRDRELLAQIPGVSRLVRNKEKERIGEILASITKKQDTRYPALSGTPMRFIRRSFIRGKQIQNPKFEIRNFKDRDKAFVKIQDGCNHRCSYCKVALVRGPSVSRPMDDILKETTELIDEGYKEIVLSGICLGAWGRDFAKPLALDFLLEKIIGLKGDFRLRLSSIEPVYVTDALIDIVSKSSKICRHFHIPLQNGDDKILSAMNRTYDTQHFFSLLKKIRKKIPDVAFTTDVMVGFPGEEEENFRRSYSFIKRMKPSRIHIFSYSKRTGTKAFYIKEAIDSSIIKKRKDLLEKQANASALNYAKRFTNKIVLVLIESRRDRKTQLLTGYTDMYVKVYLEGPDALYGRIVPAKILKVSKEGVFARPARLDNAISI